MQYKEGWPLNASPEKAAMDDPRAGQPRPRHSFADYRHDAADWITTASGDFYPDVIEPASNLYEPVLIKFGQLVDMSASSTDLLRHISDVKGPMRIQLLRVFRKCEGVS